MELRGQLLQRYAWRWVITGLLEKIATSTQAHQLPAEGNFI